jgi:hypothetical protein
MVSEGDITVFYVQRETWVQVSCIFLFVGSSFTCTIATFLLHNVALLLLCVALNLDWQYEINVYNRILSLAKIG